MWFDPVIAVWDANARMTLLWFEQVNRFSRMMIGGSGVPVSTGVPASAATESTEAAEKSEKDSVAVRASALIHQIRTKEVTLGVSMEEFISLVRGLVHEANECFQNKELEDKDRLKAVDYRVDLLEKLGEAFGDEAMVAALEGKEEKSSY